jgi:PA14 domain
MSHGQTYTFYTTSDDGVRLWVNGQLLIDILERR